MTPKLRVFLAHSFAESDREFVDRFKAFLQQRRFQLDVRTAESPQPRPFGKKIGDLIDWADVTIGLFSRRYRDPDTERWLPTPYVVSECSYALGRYKEIDGKGVYGFVEKGLRHSDLGLPTAGGEEFPVFKREDFKAGAPPAELGQYVSRLSGSYLKATGTEPKRYYKQKSLRKTVTVYRNGRGYFKNTATFIVQNARLFKSHGNGIEHSLWVPNKPAQLPDFEVMADTPLTKRLAAPVFSCAFLARGNRRMEQPMTLELLEQNSNTIRFRAIFPFPVKDNDILTYQYVWGVPNMFRAFEEEMEGDNDYDEVGVRTTHGEIGNVELRVKFEREAVRGRRPTLFSKEPFVVFSYTPKEDGILSEPESVGKIERNADYEIYERTVNELHGAMLIRWRPVSKATMERELGAAGIPKAAGRVEVAELQSRVSGGRTPEQLS